MLQRCNDLLFRYNMDYSLILFIMLASNCCHLMA
jgi:hypothetical protein